jgi:hypothetical protein
VSVRRNCIKLDSKRRKTARLAVWKHPWTFCSSKATVMSDLTLSSRFTSNGLFLDR